MGKYKYICEHWMFCVVEDTARIHHLLFRRCTEKHKAQYKGIKYVS